MFLSKQQYLYRIKVKPKLQLLVVSTGIFLFSLTLMGMGSVFFHLSLDNVVIREISAKNAANNRQAVLSIGQQWVLVVSLPFSAFALILFSGIAKHLLSKLEFGPVLRITALALPVLAMYMLISMGFQTLHRVILTTLFQNLGVSFNEIRQLSR